MLIMMCIIGIKKDKTKKSNAFEAKVICSCLIYTEKK